MQDHALHLNCDVINVTNLQLSVSLPHSISVECSTCSIRQNERQYNCCCVAAYISFMQKVCLTMPEVLFEAGLQMLRASINWIRNMLNVVVEFDNHVGKDVDLPLVMVQVPSHAIPGTTNER